jgi:chorismate synthase
MISLKDHINSEVRKHVEHYGEYAKSSVYMAELAQAEAMFQLCEQVAALGDTLGEVVEELKRLRTQT